MCEKYEKQIVRKEDHTTFAADDDLPDLI